MKIKNVLFLIVLFAGIIAITVASASADQSVNVGGNTFIIPSEAKNIQTSGDCCNFTIDNVSASIIKIKSNELDSYIHSNRLKKYDVVRLSDEQSVLYRYEDRLHNQKGILTPISKNKDSYIFKTYLYNSFSSSSQNSASDDRIRFIGIFRGFLYKNGHKENLNFATLPI